jgi:hypothetical protein
VIDGGRFARPTNGLSREAPNPHAAAKPPREIAIARTPAAGFLTLYSHDLRNKNRVSTIFYLS